jgi:hypothetical protein
MEMTGEIAANMAFRTTSAWETGAIGTLVVAGAIEAGAWTTGGRVMLRILRRSTEDQASMIAPAPMTVDRILTMGAAAALTTVAGTLAGAETTEVLPES